MSDNKKDFDPKVFEQGNRPTPKQNQNAPGHEHKMDPEPMYNKLPDGKGGYEDYKPADKLKGKLALITGGDSGIGRACAVLFAMEGADVAIVHLEEEQKDADETRKKVEGQGRKCYTFAADLSKGEECKRVVEEAAKKLGGMDILVNNCAYQETSDSIEELSEEQWDYTFKTNIYSYYHVSKHSLQHLRKSHTGSIINMASVNHYSGRSDLLDYSTTKGAIIAFTRCLSNQVVGDGIRVNAVAPGPIWTPLVVWSFTEEQRDKFGTSKPMERPGQPSEVATCCVFLAGRDSSYMSGQTLHPNGGEIVGS